ncbi:unnamed protein product [marine sediment metagenome]|uniref:IPT/TIG domain-containing protein n=1 Tax=marine sediment metagenome TaxID=412755 RepID=X1GSC3_9ZZZZ
MAAITTSTVTDTIPALGRKMLMVETPATADSDDTIAITLANYGITTFLGIIGFEHTTTDSVVTTEAPTTAVSAGVLTITIGGSSDDDEKRVYIVYGK